MSSLEDGFSELADAIVQDCEEKIRDIEATPARVLRLIHRSWVSFVQKSAYTKRAASPGQIVTRGYEIGWKIWGKRPSSERRFNLRWIPFSQKINEILGIELQKVLEKGSRTK